MPRLQLVEKVQANMTDQPPDNPGFFDQHRAIYSVPQPMEQQQPFSMQPQVTQFPVHFQFKDVQSCQFYPNQFVQFGYPQFYGFQPTFQQQFQPAVNVQCAQRPPQAAAQPPEPVPEEPPQKHEPLPIPIIIPPKEGNGEDRPKRPRRPVAHDEDKSKRRPAPVKREARKTKQPEAWTLQWQTGPFDTDDGEDETDWAEDIYY